MQIEKYKNWLVAQNYQGGTIAAQMHRAGRVEDCYGDLDELYNKDQLNSLLSELTYTTQDRRNNRPNETKIPFSGNAYNNLSSYRDAVRRYKRFVIDEPESLVSFTEDEKIKTEPESVSTQTIGLEKDMQAAIRQNISQVEEGLIITDGGRERAVESGYIDITAKDLDDVPVIIELKTGVAGQRAVAQVLSYIGSVMDEEERDDVRGILIASKFDKKAKAAARVIPSLTLMTYQFSFSFFEE
ncbi:DUF91 domain-containing protein [Parashewanella spongiae]|uniref:DUF91 domain-containing protein n=1 Tax=Parashewanella spongiae TaxID=342950 RepID=A0A3A6U3C3_9GAMM|nr:endonuclease NucS domain-containing protein [Parashewanella spongiae]MCL1077285.1 endonuclease NucS [Parashewanella spongiae]RJY18535.1 DUF91 domain-containing protein [Parashewanella spongiae]